MREIMEFPEMLDEPQTEENRKNRSLVGGVPFDFYENKYKRIEFDPDNKFKAYCEIN